MMPRHLFTIDQFLQLVESDGGAWANSELIDGQIFDQHPESPFHDQTVGLTHDILARERTGHDVVACQRIRFGAESSLRPDIAVLSRQRPDGPLTSESVRLIVEVVGTTAEVDLGLKLSVYARAGVPEYWALQPDDKFLQKFTRPVDAAHRGFYREMNRLDFAELLVD